MEVQNYSGNYKKSGIYFLKFRTTWWFYVGSTNKFTSRKTDHLRDLRRNIHYNPRLQNCFNKYGEDSMIFEVKELVAQDQLLAVEQSYLDNLFNVEGCLNIRPIAEGVKDSRTKEELKKIYSREKSQIEKDKISKSNKERTIIHGIRKRNIKSNAKLLAAQEAFVDGLQIPNFFFSKEETESLQDEAKKLYSNFPRGWGKNPNQDLIKKRTLRKKLFKEWLEKNGFMVDARRDSWYHKSKEDQQAAIDILTKHRNTNRTFRSK